MSGNPARDGHGDVITAGQEPLPWPGIRAFLAYARSLGAEVHLELLSNYEEPLAAPVPPGSSSRTAGLDTPDLTMADVKREPPGGDSEVDINAVPTAGFDTPDLTMADVKREPHDGDSEAGINATPPALGESTTPHAPALSDPDDPGPATLPGPRPDYNSFEIPHAPRTSSDAWNLPRRLLLLVLLYTNPEPPRRWLDGTPVIPRRWLDWRPVIPRHWLDVIPRHWLDGSPVIPHVEKLRRRGYRRRQSREGLAEGPLFQAYLFSRLAPFLPDYLLHEMSLNELALILTLSHDTCDPDPETDVVGISSIRQTVRLLTSLCLHQQHWYDQDWSADNAFGMAQEAREALEKLRPYIPSKSLKDGLWGFLLTYRLMLKHTRVELAEIEEMLEDVLLHLCDDDVMVEEDLAPTICSWDGGLPQILSDLRNVESDLGVLTEIALIWPASAKNYVQPFDSVRFTGRPRLALLTRAAVEKMKSRLTTRWPEDLGTMCARRELKHGPWFTYTCLTHLLNWLDGTAETEELVSVLTRARAIVRERAGPGGLGPLLDV